MKVLLLYGGKSSEHKISKVSAQFVCEGLLDSGHSVYLCGISKKGIWCFQEHLREAELPPRMIEGEGLALYEEKEIQSQKEQMLWTMPSSGLWRNANAPKQVMVDIVFPALHGHFGEDGTVQHLLDVAKLPYVGCGAFSSMVCMDKQLAKKVLTDNKIPVLPDFAIDSKDIQKGTTQQKQLQLKQCMSVLGQFPVIVKPNSNGSSIGISVANNEEELLASVLSCAKYGKLILVEPFLTKRREIEVAVIGNTPQDIKSFPPGEIILHEGEFYDYALKYQSSKKEVGLHASAQLSDLQEKKICEIAEQAYIILSCRGFARIDLFLYEEDTVVVNEINTIPGFTSISMFPKILMNAGYSASDIVNTLLSLGLDEGEKNKRKELYGRKR